MNPSVAEAHDPVTIVVMGVSGSGKSTVGALLAAALGWEFEEGDRLHPPANVAKMAAGQALDDADRWPWLGTIGAWIDAETQAGRSALISCSALKRSYRDYLTAGRPQVRFLSLSGGRTTIAARLADRRGHFMPPSLLDSQLAALEPLAADEPGVTLAVDGPPEQVAAQARTLLGLD